MKPDVVFASDKDLSLRFAQLWSEVCSVLGQYDEACEIVSE